MKLTSEEVTITLGDGVATLRRKGSSQAAVANILGIHEGNDSKAIYLDRLIHKPNETELDSYVVYGAKTTILVPKVSTVVCAKP